MIRKPRSGQARVPAMAGAAALTVTGCAAVAAPPTFLLAVSVGQIGLILVVVLAVLGWVAALRNGSKGSGKQRRAKGAAGSSGAWWFGAGGCSGGDGPGCGSDGGSGCGGGGCGA